MFALILLSIGLAMDAVAVSLVRGATGERRVWRAVEVGLFFGIAQGLMPLLGWSIGVAFAQWIEAFAHSIAFGLLAFLGVRMLIEAAGDDEPEGASDGRRSHFVALTLAAIATSIDAAAAGITLPLLSTPVVLSCLTIGGVTAVLSALAYWLGTRASARLGKLAEVVGGVVLIGLGVKILIEHLTA